MTSLLQTAAKATLTRLGLELRRRPRQLLLHPERRLYLELEHVIARHLLRRPRQEFFFVQVGAFDGITDDPIHRFVVEFGWQGVVAEPRKAAFRALAETYREQPQVILCNVAVGDAPGSRPLYKLRDAGENLPAYAPQVASFDREIVLKHGDAIPRIEEHIETEWVTCVTFDELLAPFRGEIDLLQIDAEGYDFELVKLFHASGRRAQIIHLEHKHLSRDDLRGCIDYLLTRGYRLALRGPDTIASLG